MIEEIVAKIAQGGYAAGTAFTFSKTKNENYQAGDKEQEKSRLKAAADKFEKKLKSGMDGKNAELIEAEIMLLHDDDYISFADRLIVEESLSALKALKSAEKKLCDKLESSGNSYIRERSADVKGMTKVLVDIMSGNETVLPKSPCILVGSELSPSDITLIDKEMILGILTETGSPTSHVAVLAGGLDVPYFCGVSDVLGKVRDGDFVILDDSAGFLDGFGNGSVTVNPTENIRNIALEHQEDILREKSEAEKLSVNRPTKLKVYANIGGTDETETLARLQADGIGLVRSEFLFLGRDTAPSEDEQFEAYKKIVTAMDDKEVVIRTMDIGSDKKADWLPMEKEINPALGLRGLRVSLEYTELFRTQLMAIMRAAAFGNIKIMVPMVTSVWEIDRVFENLEASVKELKSRKVAFKIPEVGVMIETPAAVMMAPELASKVRFFSIGTNDLAQYTLALDREAKGLDRYYDPMHEAIFRMVEMTVKAAHSHGIPVTVCGELGGRPEAIAKLKSLGVDELSVSFGKYAKVKRLVIDLEEKESHKAKHIEKSVIKAPADGELVPMAEIPDTVFSSGMMGECLGIIPINGNIYAPISGTVKTIARNKHAISFKNESLEVLVHVGIDTVKLNGKGFTVKVSEGQYVDQGQLVLEADMAKIKEMGFDPMVIVVKNQSEGRGHENNKEDK